MKIFLRISIFLLIFEIILGYAIYLKNSTKLTGNYISSTMRLFNKLENKFQKQSKPINLKKEELESSDCKVKFKDNHLIEIADMNFFRRAIRFQTKTAFLNNADLSDKYLVIITGNSETFGSYQDDQKRIHTLLENKLKEKFITKDIFVVNIAYPGQLINDNLRSIKSFSKIYNPDLVIFYTGGNETRLSHYYKNMTDSGESLNIENQYWYSFVNNSFNKNQECLNKKMFLSKYNFNKGHSSLDIQNYVKNGYNKIKTFLDSKEIDFIFYIHPFNNKIIGDEIIRSNIKKLRNFDIADNKFINLSNKDFDLDFLDNFHTRNSNFMAIKIFNDILEKHEKKINFKLSKKNN